MRFGGLLPVVLLGAVAAGLLAHAQPPDAPIVSVPASSVDVTDAFWSARMEVNRTVSIQHVFDKSEERGGPAPSWRTSAWPNRFVGVRRLVPLRWARRHCGG